MYTPGSPHFFYFEQDPPRWEKKKKKKKLQGFLGRKVTRQNSRTLPHALNHSSAIAETLILTELLVCKPQFLCRLPTLLYDYKRRNPFFHLIPRARSSSSRPQAPWELPVPTPPNGAAPAAAAGARFALVNSRRPPLFPGSRFAAAAASAQDQPTKRVFRLGNTHKTGAEGTTNVPMEAIVTAPLAGDCAKSSFLRAACCL